MPQMYTYDTFSDRNNDPDNQSEDIVLHFK